MIKNIQNSKTYRCGTLVYTKMGLISLFSWLLWGDFCYILMEKVVPTLVPLKLKEMGFSATVMGAMMVTIPSVLNFTITPMVSYQSDRCRSHWGRRIPYILASTPFVALLLVMIGYSKPLGELLIGLIPFELSSTTFFVVWMGFLLTFFQFFNMFVSSVFYYLFNDVVPPELIGRFTSLFRMISYFASGLYNLYIFKHAETHMTEIFVGISIIYLISFIMMGLKVKEGQYPEIISEIENPPRFLEKVQSYFKDCFFHPIYRNVYAGHVTWYLGTMINGAFLLLSAQSFGFNLEQYGKISATSEIFCAFLFIPLGWAVDRFHPIRIMMIGTVWYFLSMTMRLLFFFGIFSGNHLFVLWGFVFMLVDIGGAIYNAAEFPILMKLFPKKFYGQFCSAMSMVRAIFLSVGGILAGLFLDYIQRTFQLEGGRQYQLIPLWSMLFSVLNFVFIFRAYTLWKKLGGDHTYHPPLR